MAGLLAVGAASAQDLTVAQIGPFTGLPSPDAAEINAGAQALFDSVNATGGIGGRNIKLMKFDDGFTAPGFIAQFKVAMEAGPIALLSPIGSAAISKMMQDGLLDSTDVIVMNAIPGSEQFRNPGHPKLFHVRAGDRAQLERILGHAKVLSVNEMHVLHQDLPIGTGGLATVQDLAGRIGGMKVTSTGTKHGRSRCGQGADQQQRHRDRHAKVLCRCHCEVAIRRRSSSDLHTVLCAGRPADQSGG